MLDAAVNLFRALAAALPPLVRYLEQKALLEKAAMMREAQAALWKLEDRAAAMPADSGGKVMETRIIDTNRLLQWLKEL